MRRSEIHVEFSLFVSDHYKSNYVADNFIVIEAVTVSIETYQVRVKTDVTPHFR